MSQEAGVRSISGRVVFGIWIAFLVLSLAAVGIGVVGIVGINSVKERGAAIAADELVAARLGAELGQALGGAHTTSQALMLSTDRAQQATLMSNLFDTEIPTIEADLAKLNEAHVGDGVDEQNDLGQLKKQWAAARRLVATPGSRPGAGPDPVAAPAIDAAFDQLDAHLHNLSDYEQTKANDQVAAAALAARRTTEGLIAAVGLMVLLTAALAFWGGRRIQRAIDPAALQMRFADTLQLAQNEDEAHQILKRHLEQSVAVGSITVLNRNNSADRLEAVTELAPGSPLRRTLQHAEPGSCLAVRSGRRHDEDHQKPALFGCPVCGPCPGASSCYPLTVGGVVIGSVLVNGTSALGPSHRLRVRDSVGQAAPVLANLRNLAIAELRASTDALTALPNKRSVNDTLMRMLAQASRTLTPLSLLMLDLDHFKDINDRFGHPVGDQALAGVGAALRSALRASDFAGRNGGEEFAVMLPDTDLAGAVDVAEKIRAAIADITLPGLDVTLSASVGVATYPDHALGADRLIRLADAALYVAKRSGRNRVEVANPAGELAMPAVGQLTAGSTDR